MEETLSAGALSVMMSGEAVDEPVLVQVLGSLKLDGIVEHHERYRLLISDGQHVISHVIIAVKLNNTGTTIPPERFSIIHVKEYFTLLVPRDGVIRVMLVLTDVQVVFSAGEIQRQIGCPSALFDEDVVINYGDTLLSEPVFESVSTVDISGVDLAGKLSKVAIEADLPVVQALPEVKLQSVTFSSAIVPNISSSSVSKQLIVSNTSSKVLPTQLSPVPIHFKQPQPLLKPLSVPVTPVVVQPTYSSVSTSKPSTLQNTPTPLQMSSPDSCTGTFGAVMTPIVNLRPTAKTWNIKARVTAKSPIKPWARGSGCSFTVDLADESGEIKATVFTEWVEKYYAMLQKDKVYYISKGNLKTSNKRYNHLNHDYELIINGATSVVPCDELVAVVEAKWKFVPLNEVKGCKRGSVIDVIGVCTCAADLESVQTRGGIIPKREVTLVDQSATSIKLKLWGEHTRTFEPSNCTIIAIRGAMVKEYLGVMNLTTLVSSVVRINPDIVEAQQLRTWYESVIDI